MLRMRSRTDLIEKDAELVVRLLSDVHRVGLDEHAEVDERARVDLRARHDRGHVAHDDVAPRVLRGRELRDDRDEGADHQSFPAGGGSG